MSGSSGRRTAARLGRGAGLCAAALAIAATRWIFDEETSDFVPLR